MLSVTAGGIACAPDTMSWQSCPQYEQTRIAIVVAANTAANAVFFACVRLATCLLLFVRF
jgi:hypothetical protein